MVKLPLFVVNCERIGRRSAYYVRFPINNDLIQKIKDLPEETRKWNPSAMAWELSTYSLFLLIKKYKKVKDIHFDFGNEDSRKVFINQIKKIQIAESEKRKFIQELNIKKEHWVKYKQELEETYEKYSDKLHALLNDDIKLYPHQIVAAMFMNVTRNTLISHEMGLGKTASSIVYVEMNGFEKVVVITPNSLKFNYYYEVQKFTKSLAYVVNWNKNNCSIEDAKYIIVNYDFFNPSKYDRFLKKWKKLNLNKIDCVILDECQKIKNTKSNIYRNFKKTFNKKIFNGEKESKIFLSGTPAPNRAYELYSVLNQISPIDFPTKKYYYEYYCGMKYDVGGWGYVADEEESRFEELFHKIAPFTHRKKKKDALKDLPDKIYQRIIIEMTKSEEKTYNDIESSVVNEYVKNPTNNPLTIMLRLRQYVSMLKVSHVMEIVKNIIETGEKVIIVDMFKDSLYELKKLLGDIAVLHTGDQTVEERSEVVKNFQNPNSNIKVFLGSIQTANYGLTLTAASKMFILTLPYTVGEYDQVADRCHRIGQKNSVNIYPLIFPNTIDDYIYSKIEYKRKEIVKVLDNENYKSEINDSILSDVINKIKEKHGK